MNAPVVATQGPITAEQDIYIRFESTDPRNKGLIAIWRLTEAEVDHGSGGKIQGIQKVARLTFNGRDVRTITASSRPLSKGTSVSSSGSNSIGIRVGIGFELTRVSIAGRGPTDKDLSAGLEKFFGAINSGNPATLSIVDSAETTKARQQAATKADGDAGIETSTISVHSNQVMVLINGQPVRGVLTGGTIPKGQALA